MNARETIASTEPQPQRHRALALSGFIPFLHPAITVFTAADYAASRLIRLSMEDVS
jgi:hypothetical protein